MMDFLKYFKYIIKTYSKTNTELSLETIEEFIEEIENDFTVAGFIEEDTNLIHMYLYRKKNIDFINYFHFWRCTENNMQFPI